MHGERAGVEDAVGALAQLDQLGALALDTGQRTGLAAERVRAPRLAEAAHQHVVAGVEEQDLEAVAGVAQLVEHARIVGEELALAQIDAEADAADALERARTELEHARHQDDGQIVDAVEAEIFEDVYRSAPSGPGKAGDDDDFEGGVHRLPAAPVRASHPLRG